MISTEPQSSITRSVVSIRSDWDIIASRMAARAVARKMGFNTIDQARIATATSELTRNIIAYAGEGSVTISPIQRGDRRGIEIIFEDNGPGIADTSFVWDETPHHNGNGGQEIEQGMGLKASHRLMDEMDIQSMPGVGTTITCRKWLR